MFLLFLQGKKKKKKKDDGEEPGPQVNGGANPDDPFGDDEDDAKLQALAASFEAKYVSDEKCVCVCQRRERTICAVDPKTRFEPP